jgi:transposase-like protein
MATMRCEEQDRKPAELRLRKHAAQLGLLVIGSLGVGRSSCLLLKQRGLQGVELVISDDHAGLRQAIAEVFTVAVWPRCDVHFLRNALDYLPRKADNDCLTVSMANS